MGATKEQLERELERIYDMIFRLKGDAIRIEAMLRLMEAEKEGAQ